MRIIIGYITSIFSLEREEEELSWEQITTLLFVLIFFAVSTLYLLSVVYFFQQIGYLLFTGGHSRKCVLRKRVSWNCDVHECVGCCLLFFWFGLGGWTCRNGHVEMDDVSRRAQWQVHGTTSWMCASCTVWEMRSVHTDQMPWVLWASTWRHG